MFCFCVFDFKAAAAQGKINLLEGDFSELSFSPNIKFHPAAEFILAASVCPHPRQVPAGAVGSRAALPPCPLGRVPGGCQRVSRAWHQPGGSGGTLVWCHSPRDPRPPLSDGRKPMLMGGAGTGTPGRSAPSGHSILRQGAAGHPNPRTDHPCGRASLKWKQPACSGLPCCLSICPSIHPRGMIQSKADRRTSGARRGSGAP